MRLLPPRSTRTDTLFPYTTLFRAGVLEIHPWGSTLAAMEQPDMIIMDLDPGPGVEWQQVIDAAQEVRERLEKLGLAAFLKTSGGKGLHLVSPLKRQDERREGNEGVSTCRSRWSPTN